MGIDDESIREAIATGHLVEKGAMNAMRKFSDTVLTPKNCSEQKEPCDALKAFGVENCSRSLA